MPVSELLGAPLHPALAHFPVAATVFAALALLAAAARPRESRAPWVSGAALLLGSALASGLAAAVAGHAWADSLGLLPAGEWVPPAAARAGVLRRHALLGAGSLLAASLAPAAGLRALATLAAHAPRSSLAASLAAALLSALLALAAGHDGGRMAHGDARDGALPRVSASGSP